MIEKYSQMKLINIPNKRKILSVKLRRISQQKRVNTRKEI